MSIETMMLVLSFCMANKMLSFASFSQNGKYVFVLLFGFISILS